MLLGDGYSGLYSSEFNDIFRTEKQDIGNGKKQAIDNSVSLSNVLGLLF